MIMFYINDTYKILLIFLFSDKQEILEKIDFGKINYDDLIGLASSHLMIPALYIRFRKNNLLNLINKDFKNYIKYIYEINKNRNKTLVKELSELSQLFTEKNIDHVFLKGSAYIALKRFHDLGERMIGDIDVLVAKSDFDKAIELSQKIGYFSNAEFIFDTKHHPRMNHPKKLFSLEIHNRLLKKKNILLKPEDFLKRKISTKSNLNIPSKIDFLAHTIYNFQINDFGNLKASFSLRSLYDILILKSEINDMLESKHSKYINNFFLISDYIGVTNTNIKQNFFNRIYLCRFKAKTQNKIFYLFDNFICNQINLARTRINNFFRLFTSSNYRSYLLFKIKQKI